MWKRITALMILVMTTSLLVTPMDAEARGGRGGGGGRSAGGSRGGGAYSGGRTMNRTPTMSRASNRTTQGKAQQARQTIQQRPTASNRSELRQQVNRYAQNRPSQPIARQPLSQRAQDFSKTRGSQIAQNRQLSDQVSQRLRQTRPNHDWFDRNFFDRHNIDAAYVNSRLNWWRPAAWATLASWGAWQWSTPNYYEGGYAYPITPEETTYTYTPEQSQVNANVSEEWLPLGVFAVANNSSAAAETNRFLQLAINRQGEIAGVLYNSTTDAAQDLIGMVEPESQIVYWSLANRTDSPIASTGIYNLMGDKSSINVHFADGSDQTWILVRLQQEQ